MLYLGSSKSNQWIYEVYLIVFYLDGCIVGCSVGWLDGRMTGCALGCDVG